MNGRNLKKSPHKKGGAGVLSKATGDYEKKFI